MPYRLLNIVTNQIQKPIINKYNNKTHQHDPKAKTYTTYFLFKVEIVFKSRLVSSRVLAEIQLIPLIITPFGSPKFKKKNQIHVFLAVFNYFNFI